MTDYIDTFLPEPLRALWNEFYKPEFYEKITDGASRMAREACRLSNEAKDDLIAIWDEDAQHAKETASLFMSLSTQVETEAEEYEWKAAAMDSLVSYVLRKAAVVKAREGQPEISTAPPRQELGESTEHYKKRLLEYASML